MNRDRGFTLIELMIVVAIIAIILAIAIPSLMNARKAGNEASAVNSIRTITTCNEQYRTRFLAYAPALSDLSGTGYVDGVLASGTKAGYSFAYSAGTSTYEVTAIPLDPGASGDRGFYVDTTGVIRFESAGAATSTSPHLD